MTAPGCAPRAGDRYAFSGVACSPDHEITSFQATESSIRVVLVGSESLACCRASSALQVGCKRVWKMSILSP
jgi:hypothetical protein